MPQQEAYPHPLDKPVRRKSIPEQIDELNQLTERLRSALSGHMTKVDIRLRVVERDLGIESPKEGEVEWPREQ